MAETRERVPHHLRRFVVEQDYDAYTAVDQAVWRFILLQMYDRLERTAHPAYARGLTQTGMTVDRIPRIAEMDRCLSAFGWGAVGVDGFIPPRAFQEFQALGILPIATEIRRVEHLPYTPAPDIVHEAGGHAPILPDSEYAAFLRLIGDYGMRAFGSRHDADMHNVIYRLSVVKEQRDSTAEEVAAAERALAELVAEPVEPSEAARLARLYWWTVEYGLVGTLDDYRLYGAGLLSSLAESHFCHEPGVRKLALTRDCVDVDYDITRPQPQLFVARDFAQLGEVLEQVCAQFAFRSGGLQGLSTALAAREVATLELDSGLQVTGLLAEMTAEAAEPLLVVMSGPCALGAAGHILDGEGGAVHRDGLALLLARAADGRALHTWSERELLQRAGAGPDRRVRIACAAGLIVEGRLERTPAIGQGRCFVLGEVRVLQGERPVWTAGDGQHLIVGGCGVATARAGAEDGSYWPQVASPTLRAPQRRPERAQQRALRQLYERAQQGGAQELSATHLALQHEHPDEWLLRWNLLEALTEQGLEPERCAQLAAELWQLEERFAHRNPIAMGLRYLGYAENGSRTAKARVAARR